MTQLIHPFDAKGCYLCGAPAEPTGEHKIKASSLRDQFGSQKMVIVRDGEAPVPVQGIKSKRLHFARPMCAPCNNARTQMPDDEWDRFRRAALDLVAEGREPVEAFDDPRYWPTGTRHSQPYLDVLRYLAKLLCGHLADSGAPRFDRLTRFARRLSDDCPILIEVDRDQTYARFARIQGDHPYAGHAGLVVFSNTDTSLITGFYSAITVGGLQCRITFRFDEDEREILRTDYPQFLTFWAERSAAASRDPVPAETLVKLGLRAADQP